MKGLLSKPSLDSDDARDALRVVDYFDKLVERRASLPALIRAAAGLAGCDVVWERGDGTRISNREALSADHAAAAGDHAAPTASGALSAEVHADGRVSLCRRGAARALDALLVERLALAASALGARSTHERDSTALLEDVLDPTSSVVVRYQAARSLGFDAERRLAVLSVDRSQDLSAEDALRTLLRGTHPHRPPAPILHIGPHAVAVHDGPLGSRATQELRAGLAHAGDLEHLPEAVSRSQAALRFALIDVHGPTTRIVDFDSLGLLALLLDRSPDELAQQQDVHVIGVLSQGERSASPEDLVVLDAVCRHASMRLAAAELHLHHSTVGTRVELLSRRTGWQLNDPVVRQRARLALLAYRMLAEAGRP